MYLVGSVVLLVVGILIPFILLGVPKILSLFEISRDIFPTMNQDFLILYLNIKNYYGTWISLGMSLLVGVGGVYGTYYGQSFTIIFMHFFAYFFLTWVICSLVSFISAIIHGSNSERLNRLSPPLTTYDMVAIISFHVCIILSLLCFTIYRDDIYINNKIHTKQSRIEKINEIRNIILSQDGQPKSLIHDIRDRLHDHENKHGLKRTDFKEIKRINDKEMLKSQIQYSGGYG